MGKGIIKVNKGAGLYSVEIVYNTARVDAQVSKLTSRVAIFDSKIAIVQSQLSLLQAALASDTGNDELRAQVIATQRALNILILQRTSALKYIDYLTDNTPANRTIDVWCADLVEDIAVGMEVGLSEVPNEYGRSNIVPAYFGQHGYKPDQHGYLTPAVSMLPTSCYFNRSLFPAWQKWRVRYRYGSITAIDYDNDKCSVSLDQATSSEQGINVNNVTALSNVPIVYMNCNAAAFEVGDHVQIKFDDHKWQDATVTGFYSNPQPCQLPEGIRIKINGNSPSWYYKARLFHPDYGYVSELLPCDAGDPGCPDGYRTYMMPIPGTPSDFEVPYQAIPGGILSECYIEIENIYHTYPVGGDYIPQGPWHIYKFMPDVLLEVTNIGGILTADLANTDYFIIDSPADGGGTLPGLGGSDRQHIRIYNDGLGVITLDDIVIPKGYTAHFYWTGTEWSTTFYYADVGGVTVKIPTETVERPSYRGIEHFNSRGKPYLTMTGAITGSADWFAPVSWMRCQVKIGDMTIDPADGFYIANFNAFTISLFGSQSAHWSSAALCGCSGAVTTEFAIQTVYNEDPANDIIPFDMYVPPKPWAESGSCNDDASIGFIFGRPRYQYLGDDTAILSGAGSPGGSRALVSDDFALTEPTFTSFEYFVNAYVENTSQVFDAWWAGDKTYCIYTEHDVADVAFGEYERAELPVGYY